MLIGSKSFGVDQVWVIDRSHSHRNERLLHSRVLDASDRICPALHTRTGEGDSLSVCGRRSDLVVLARHHLDRWCLGHNQECPHWRGLQND